jgi:hypothetical protein
MSNQRLPNEDIQKVRDVEDRLIIITTFKEATGKLEGAFNQLAEYLSGRCIAHQYYIKLFVNPQDLKFDTDQNIMQEASASYLKSWSDALFLYELAGLTCYVELKTNYSWIKDKKYLSELAGTEYESDLPPNLVESIKASHKSNNGLLK